MSGSCASNTSNTTTYSVAAAISSRLMRRVRWITDGEMVGAAMVQPYEVVAGIGPDSALQIEKLSPRCIPPLDTVYGFVR